MNEKLVYHTLRDAYSTSDIQNTMTAGELIELLQDYDPDTPIYLSFDHGYTYGNIVESRLELEYEDEDY